MAGISWDSSVANKRWVIYLGVNQHMAWNHSQLKNNVDAYKLD